MQVNITIDRGNTATKFVVWEGRRALSRQTVSDFTHLTAENLDSRYPGCKVIFCSVAGDNEQFMEMLAGVFGKERVTELTNATTLPITIDYGTPQTLGMDRVAAAAGAWTLHPGSNLLVADIGTAATYDVVDSEGCFRGGNIAPGIGLRLQSLRHFTAKLPEVESRGDTPEFGYSTETAMRAGAVRGVAAEILYYLSLLPGDTRLILTGGWGSDIARYIPKNIKVTVKPCLVSIGLNSILSYNETK